MTETATLAAPPAITPKPKLWHSSGGCVFLCPPAISTMGDYKEFVRKAYGSLRGVQFFTAANRRDAEFRAAELRQVEVTTKRAVYADDGEFAGMLAVSVDRFGSVDDASDWIDSQEGSEDFYDCPELFERWRREELGEEDA